MICSEIKGEVNGVLDDDYEGLDLIAKLTSEEENATRMREVSTSSVAAGVIPFLFPLLL